MGWCEEEAGLVAGVEKRKCCDGKVEIANDRVLS